MPQRLFLRTPPKEPGAVNDIRSPPLDRLQQLEIILWVEFQVSVLDENYPALRLAESTARRSPFAAIFRLKENADVLRAQPISGRRKNHSAALAALLIQHAKKLSRPVGRAVVDDHDLHIDLHSLNTRENLLDGRAFVVDRHDDREPPFVLIRRIRGSLKSRRHHFHFLRAPR